MGDKCTRGRPRQGRGVVWLFQKGSRFVEGGPASHSQYSFTSPMVTRTQLALLALSRGWTSIIPGFQPRRHCLECPCIQVRLQAQNGGLGAQGGWVALQAHRRLDSHLGGSWAMMKVMWGCGRNRTSSFILPKVQTGITFSSKRLCVETQLNTGQPLTTSSVSRLQRSSISVMSRASCCNRAGTVLSRPLPSDMGSETSLRMTSASSHQACRKSGEKEACSLLCAQCQCQCGA